MLEKQGGLGTLVRLGVQPIGPEPVGPHLPVLGFSVGLGVGCWGYRPTLQLSVMVES